MGQDVFGVFKPFAHLCIVRLKSGSQGVSKPFSLLINVSDDPSLARQYYFSVVLEVHLDDFVAQSEHYRMASPHPLLHVRDLCTLTTRAIEFFLSSFRFVAFQIGSEVLQ